MPRAPEGFAALTFQPLSFCQSFDRHVIWSRPKPASSRSAQPIAWLPVYSAHEEGTGPNGGGGFTGLLLVPVLGVVGGCALRAASSAAFAAAAASAAAASALACASRWALRDAADTRS